MKDWRKMQGSQELKPAEFDATSSAVTVYQRRNIQRVTVDNDDGTKSELWEYDERQMTHQEYVALLAGSVTDLELALVELYEGGM